MAAYLGDDDLGERARAVAADCPDCTVRELSVASGAATHYAFCERHHRDLYARHAERVAERRGRPDDRDDPSLTPSEEASLERLGLAGAVDPVAGRADVDVGVLAAALDGGTDDRQDAAEALDAVARADPERVVPVVPALKRTLAAEADDGGGGGWFGILTGARSALGEAAAVDDPTLERLAAAPWRDIAWQRHAAAALATVAERDVDRLLAAGDPVGEADVPAVLAGYADLADDEVDPALTVFEPVARRRPAALVPVADALGAGLDGRNEPVTFQAARILGRVAEVDPDVLAPHAEALAACCESDDGTVRFAGAVALARWPPGEDPPVDRERLRSLLRERVEPATYREEQVRAAARALGHVGTADDVALLEWVQLPTVREPVHEAAEAALARLRERGVA